MGCEDCKYFKIIQRPLWGKDGLYDMGRVICKKYDLIKDFSHSGQFKYLKCPDKKTNKRKEHE